jgi:serine/threonine-protein kinase
MTTPKLLSNRYELGETLGYGGMSEVHKGRDVRLSRDIAVKVLRADLARDPQFQLRFRREAQNAAALNHPAIVAVYDTGETQSEFGPLPYIVMEYVEGRTLRDIVKSEGPLDASHAIEVMADVSAALDFSHRHGIIHRDVKPANIMITRTGAVKVMDFGIARALADSQNVTQTAAVIGTAQYLSPEQARGEAVDARSDVYASGCVLFELLTGEPPFTGDSPVAVAYQHVREDPPSPSDVNPTVPTTLDAVVLKAMSKNPANRYQSAAEMRADLVRVLSGQRPSAPMVLTDEDRTTLMGSDAQSPSPSHPSPTSYEESGRRGRGWFAVLVTLLVVGILGLGAYLLWPTSGEQTLRMPNVLKENAAAAELKLKNDKFVVELTQIASTKEEIGTVVQTNPEPGTIITRGQKVTLRIGAGPENVKVPSLSGLSQTEANAALQKQKLTLSPVTQTEVSSDSQVGKVIRQDPPAGETVAPGTAVTVTIGKAEEQNAVPDVVNQTFDQAKGNLEQLGFRVERRDVDSTRDQGVVVRQSPSAGTKGKVGTTITLEVSKGRNDPSNGNNNNNNFFQMPDLRGLSENEAKEALRERGHTGDVAVQQRVVTSPTDDRKVINHNPIARTVVQRNQGVALVVGRFTAETPPSPGETT